MDSSLKMDPNLPMMANHGTEGMVLPHHHYALFPGAGDVVSLWGLPAQMGIDLFVQLSRGLNSSVLGKNRAYA
jgi:hypothetical protein